LISNNQAVSRPKVLFPAIFQSPGALENRGFQWLWAGVVQKHWEKFRTAPSITPFKLVQTIWHNYSMLLSKVMSCFLLGKIFKKTDLSSILYLCQDKTSFLVDVGGVD